MSATGSVTVLTGRESEMDAVRAGVDGGQFVVITGGAGLGKTALVRGALGRRRSVWAAGLAALAFRPLVPIARAVRAHPERDGPVQVASWLAGLVGDVVFVLDDAQFADALTLEVVAEASKLIPTVVIVRTGEPRSAACVATLGAVEGARVVELGELSASELAVICVAHGASGEKAAAAAATAAGNPLWALHTIGATPEATLTRALAARLGRADLPARSVVAALGLLGRPARRDLFGDAADACVAAGLARLDGDLLVAAAPLLAEVAAARLTERDRAEMHLALAESLADRGEAARHFQAGGDFDAAVEAAQAAAAHARSAVERAGHLAVAAACSNDPADHLAAAAAALAAGDLGAAQRWAGEVADGDDPDWVGEADAVLATAARRAGELDEAAARAAHGLAAIGPIGGETRRVLLIEQFLAGRSGDSDAASALVAACAGSAQEPMALMALAADAVARREPGWQRLAERAAKAAESAGQVVLALEVQWLTVRGWALVGDAARADRAARAGREAAAAAGAEGWADRFRIESAWLTVIACGPGATEPTGVLGADVLRLADAGRLEEAAALLAGSEGVREAAVASCLAWWDHADDAAASAARAALTSGDDPVAAILAGVTAAWVGEPVKSPVPPVAAEAAAVAASEADAVDAFVAAQHVWSAMSARAWARCAWAAADRAAAGGDGRASELFAAAVAAMTAAGVHALEGRLGALARQSGFAYNRPRRRSDEARLSARETEVLRLVGAGLSTGQIARRLGISPATVTTHVRAALTKLGAGNRREAAAMLA